MRSCLSRYLYSVVPTIRKIPALCIIKLGNVICAVLRNLQVHQSFIFKLITLLFLGYSVPKILRIYISRYRRITLKKTTPLTPWRLDIVRAFLMGTHDPQSPLHQLCSQQDILEKFFKSHVLTTSKVMINSAKCWPQNLFWNQLITEIVECNPHLTKNQLLSWLKYNPDGTICGWDLAGCNLKKLPELFGALNTPDFCLDISNNNLETLPDSFGFIHVSNLVMHYNKFDPLPDCIAKIRVKRELWLDSKHFWTLPNTMKIGGDLCLAVESRDEFELLPNFLGDTPVFKTVWLMHVRKYGFDFD